MNAPTARFPKREDYEPVVLSFLPTAEGEGLKMRASLLLTRDRCAATKPIACEEAWHILDLIERTVTRDAFRPMPDAELAMIRYILIKLVTAASEFDALFGPPSSLEGIGDRG